MLLLKLTKRMQFILITQTGHLRTSNGSYFIEPRADSGDVSGVDGAPLRHVLYNVPVQQLAAHETLLSPSTSHRKLPDVLPQGQ